MASAVWMACSSVFENDGIARAPSALARRGPQRFYTPDKLRFGQDGAVCKCFLVCRSIHLGTYARYFNGILAVLEAVFARAQLGEDFKIAGMAQAKRGFEGRIMRAQERVCCFFENKR